MTSSILTINGGSSSIKFALFDQVDPPQRSLTGAVERIGVADTVINAQGANYPLARNEPFPSADLAQAGERLIDWLGKHVALETVAGIGHRVVHGGPRFIQAELLNAELIDALKRISPLDPDHLPGEIALIDSFLQRLPRVRQVACFDTAFHRDMPRVAQLLPVPRRYEASGVRRYGFHGLSYTYLVEELARVAGPESARGRLVLAHLGSGASMVAVRDGKCVDTTMALTPTSGLVMGERTGDLDPGFLIYVLRQERMTVEQVAELVNRKSGLLGVSGISSDMKDLLDRESTEPHAAEAVELFCRQAAKHAAAMAVAAGGLDTLVFSAGIGERSAPVRERICTRLGFLGIRIDPARNAVAAPVISTDDSTVTVRVIPTDEEITIARQTLATVVSSSTTR
jgi:acetate kinase